MKGKIVSEEDWEFILIAENDADNRFLAEVDDRCGADGTLRLWYKEMTGIATLGIRRSVREVNE
jgi:hypothetical protein